MQRTLTVKTGIYYSRYTQERWKLNPGVTFRSYALPVLELPLQVHLIYHDYLPVSYTILGVIWASVSDISVKHLRIWFALK